MQPLTSTKSFSEIFRNLLDGKGLKIKEVAKAVNVPEATLFRYLRNIDSDPCQSLLVPLAQYFQITVNELLGIQKPNVKFCETAIALKSNANLIRRIPIIGWEDVKEWAYKGPAILPKDYSDWVYFEGQTDLKTFALPIENYAYKYVFPKNSVIIVESQSKYRPDDYVVACINRNKVSIRQVSEDDGMLYLNTLTPAMDSEPLASPNYVYGKIIRFILNFSKPKAT